MATDDFKKIVAREAASGERTSDIARRYGYSHRGMAKLLATAELQCLTAKERDKLDELAEQYRAQLVMGGATALENVIRVVEDPDHPMNLATSRGWLDKILPTRNQTPAVAIGVSTVKAEVLAEATEKLERLLLEWKNKNPVSDEKYTFIGLEGIETG